MIKGGLFTFEGFYLFFFCLYKKCFFECEGFFFVLRVSLHTYSFSLFLFSSDHTFKCLLGVFFSV